MHFKTQVVFFSLNNSRVRYIDWSFGRIHRDYGAFLIDDDVMWNKHNMMGAKHANNGTAKYRIIRDAKCMSCFFRK